MTDGGPAFPFKCQAPTTGPEFYYGMSLREYFAAKAMQGIISGCGNSDGEVEYTAAIVAENAFKMADAMLVEREKP